MAEGGCCKSQHFNIWWSVNAFGFCGKKYYLCHTKEESALDTRALSSFLGKNQTYKGCFTSDVEKNTSEIIFFLGVFVFFLGQVGAIISDVEPQKVKLHLFSQGADLTFQGSTQVVFRLNRCTQKHHNGKTYPKTWNDYVLPIRFVIGPRQRRKNDFSRYAGRKPKNISTFVASKLLHGCIQ